MTESDISKNTYIEKVIEIDFILNAYGNQLNDEQYNNISQYQELSEENIKKYISKLNAYRVSQYQNLSIQFIIDNITYLDVDALKDNSRLKKLLNESDINADEFFNDLYCANFIMNSEEIPEQYIELSTDPLIFNDFNETIINSKKAIEELKIHLENELDKEGL